MVQHFLHMTIICYHYSITNCNSLHNLSLGILCVHLLVDLVTKIYGTPGMTTVRVDDINKYKYMKLFYAYYQIIGTGSQLSICDGIENLGYNSLIAIQSSAFLMTLKRKNIIRW